MQKTEQFKVGDKVKLVPELFNTSVDRETYTPKDKQMSLTDEYVIGEKPFGTIGKRVWIPSVFCMFHPSHFSRI